MVVPLTDEKIDKILEQTAQQKNKSFVSWLKEKQALGLNYYFTPNIYFVCWSIAKKIHTEDMDHVTVVTGLEGTGKSTLTSMLAVTVSPSMSITHVCYEPKDFFNALKVCKKGDTIWIDEGALFLFSRQSTSKNSVNVVKLLSVIRQLNLHIVICIPNFFTIDSYVREHRVSSLFYLTARGKFHYIPRKTVLFIANACKKSKNILQYPLKKGTFMYGSYNHDFGTLNDLTKEAYISRKTDNMQEFLESLEQSFNDAEASAKIDNSPQFISVKDAAARLAMAPNTIRNKIKEGTIKAIKIGQGQKSKLVIDREYLESVIANGVV